MTQSRLALSLVFLAACSTHPTDEDNPTTRSASAIVAGDADIGDPAVVAVGPRRIACDDPLAPFCSGVLVAPRVVLTAAHCFVGQRPGEPYEVFLGNDVSSGGEFHGVTRIVTPDGYDGGNGGGDLALLVLDSTANAAPVAMGTLSGSDSGKAVKLAGFGVTDDGGGIGTKRIGTGIIASIDVATFRVTPSPSMTCAGDSGGPLLLQGAGGDMLVGITSYGDPGCTMFAENARVDTFAAFIDGVVAESPDAGADPDPADSPPPNVCGGSCSNATECGVGFDCPVSADGTGKCSLNGLPAGDFGARCGTANDCGSKTCARLGSAPTSCLCLSTCQIGGPSSDGSIGDENPSAPSDTGCGCRSGGKSARSAGYAGWLALAIIIAFRRRKIVV